MNREMKEMAFVLNLPSEITIDIFSRLPIRTVISCKCVCKKWLDQISSPEFVKHHLSGVTPGLIVSVREINKTICRMFEFEDQVGLQHHDLHYKPVMKINPNTLSSFPDANIWMICSVNGLVCLRDLSNIFLGDESSKLDALYICNPITREYIPLPLLPMFMNDTTPRGSVVVTYGIGISELSGQYEVVRISHMHIPVERSDSRLSNLKIGCMVYTLGTHSWRSIELNVTYKYDYSSVGVFVNGNLHWLVGDAKQSQQISSFDLETELFRPLPPPFPSGLRIMASLTVLGNCLCFCDYIWDEKIDIWIMKEYGVQESWTKEFVVRLHANDYFGGHYPDRFCALKFFKDGDILMHKENGCLFYHCKKTETNPRNEYFEPGRDRWLCKALLHTPSLVSLRRLGLENVSSFPNDH